MGGQRGTSFDADRVIKNGRFGLQPEVCSHSVPLTDAGGNFQMRYFRGLEPEWEIVLPDTTRTLIGVSPYAIDDLTEVTLAVKSH
jgi:hypothetical protein